MKTGVQLSRRAVAGETPATAVFTCCGWDSRAPAEALLLPPRVAGQPPILDQVDAHHITGSERAKAADGSLGDYVDGCENHLLLANGYAKLAEIVGGNQANFSSGPIITTRYTRVGRIIMARRNRVIEG